MCMRKPMSTQQALRTFKKFLKWNSGEIDEWDKRNRFPPRETLRRMYAAIQDALAIVDKLHLTKDLVLNEDFSTLVKTTSGRVVIEIAAKGKKLKHLQF